MVEFCRTLVRNLYHYHRKEILEAVKNEYRNWENPGQHPITVRDEVLDTLSDGLYAAPTIRAAELHARQNSALRSGSTTFLYVFKYETKTWDHGSVNGATVGEDLPYILCYPLLHPNGMQGLPYNGSFTRQERAVSEAMMRFVSNFVKTGCADSFMPFSTNLS